MLFFLQDPKVKCAAVCVYPARVTDVKNYMNTKAEKVRIASGNHFFFKIICKDLGWTRTVF